MSERSFRRARTRAEARWERRRRRLGIVAGVSIGATALTAPTVQAADFFVENVSDNGTGSLRQAIIDANNAGSADRILFQSGVSGEIDLASDLTVINGPTQIIGPGAGQVTIYGGYQHQALSFNPSVAGAPSSVSGLTFRAGESPFYGGAIQNEDGTISVSASVFRVSAAPRGGAIHSNAGGMTVAGSTFIGNYSEVTDGGAIYADGGTLTVRDSVFRANRSQANYADGGAIFGNTATTTISGSLFRGNTAEGRGGAVYSRAQALTIGGSDFISNSSVSSGGALGVGFSATPGHNVSITGSTFTGNIAAFDGGGADLNARPVISITGSTFAGNSAFEGGGIDVNNQNGPVTISASTITGNFAGYTGGGIDTASLSASARVTVAESTISGNEAEFGGGIASTRSSGTDLPPVLTSTILADNQAVRGDELFTRGGAPAQFQTSFSLIESPSDAINPTGPNIQGVDPQLGPLAENGGPTQTQALVAGSPAIDKGLSSLSTDQRGSPRPLDDPANPNAAGGNGADIGAFEAAVPAVTPTPTPTPRPKCNGVTATIVASGPTTNGTAKRDVIVGRTGKDKINARGGNDLICARGGNDIVNAGGGNDTAFGQAGRDTLRGQAGKDKLNGAAGRDVLRGGAGKDRLAGGAGKDDQRQ